MRGKGRFKRYLGVKVSRIYLMREARKKKESSMTEFPELADVLLQPRLAVYNPPLSSRITEA